MLKSNLTTLSINLKKKLSNIDLASTIQSPHRNISLLGLYEKAAALKLGRKLADRLLEKLLIVFKPSPSAFLDIISIERAKLEDLRIEKEYL